MELFLTNYATLEAGTLWIIKTVMAHYSSKYCDERSHLSARMSKPGCLYTVSFDESFNKAIQKEQVDPLLRFWDTDKNCIVSRYTVASVFVGHTLASDLLKGFLKGLALLDQVNMVQVAMD